jgi:hypothetical protein
MDLHRSINEIDPLSLLFRRDTVWAEWWYVVEARPQRRLTPILTMVDTRIIRAAPATPRIEALVDLLGSGNAILLMLYFNHGKTVPLTLYQAVLLDFIDVRHIREIQCTEVFTNVLAM